MRQPAAVASFRSAECAVCPQFGRNLRFSGGILATKDP